MIRHEFLSSLHARIRPAVYVEVGVQTGASLALSAAPLSIGIDPHPVITRGLLSTNHLVFSETSDSYFGKGAQELGDLTVDFAFIDGMHLFEYALRDFANIERHSHPKTVVVFDDVLPRNREEATREQHTADWTGDVWRVYYWLKLFRPDLRLILVDTQPTGTLVVTGLDAAHVWPVQLDAPGFQPVDVDVPPDILNRHGTWMPSAAINEIDRWMNA